MRELRFKTFSNQEIWELIDKELPHIFIPNFNPNGVLHWWNTDVQINNTLKLKNVEVRNMKFDLQINLEELRQIIDLNTNISIYQFEKPIPGSLNIDNLSEKARYTVLKQNKLKHIFWIDFEFITISSFDSEFIQAIEVNPKFSNRIIKNS